MNNVFACQRICLRQFRSIIDSLQFPLWLICRWKPPSSNHPILINHLLGNHCHTGLHPLPLVVPAVASTTHRAIEYRASEMRQCYNAQSSCVSGQQN